MPKYYLSIWKNVKIIIYGKNANDNSIYDKNKQLLALGFPNVYVYPGGLFEWTLLQELYDFENFPSTRKIKDCLVFKPPQKLNVAFIMN